MEKLNVGGQVVIEGVMMRSPNYYSVAVRKPDNTISVKRQRIKTRSLSKMVFIRGVTSLYETLVIGFDAIMYSANESTGEKEKLGKNETIATIAFSVVFALLLFVAIPFYLTTIVSKNHSIMFNIIDGIIRTVIFISYLLVISWIPEVRVMFQYHGAEHMSIHAYEAGKKLKVEEARKFPTMHPRCGTSFLLFVLLVSILVFSIITSENWVIKLGSRVLLLPAIAGISYELLKISARHKENPLLGAIVLPGLMLQKLTTKVPNDSQLEVALKSLKDVLEAESSSEKTSRLPHQQSHQSTAASP
ncbi:DUF1385 domain-containing protein [Candidatus Woesearchaeota archaeon]|nr:DUF1385 domain-containing protein [Candidatus Woesearchaeota archaeon]